MPKKVSRQSKLKTILARPPIVAVLGHVDHGKTTLLDAIRQSNITAKESGGITQHIGAYQIEIDTKEGKQKITFIDTPGHEAFSKMRSRGASVTDLVVLVISAVEGVKPQTEESLKHIEKANVPFIVAATKMDLPQANLDRVHKHLSKLGILTEGYGGNIVVLPVSAVTKKGVQELLEMILLLCEMKGLEGSALDPLSGIIIESKLDNKRGPLATILVKRGRLKRGSDIYLGTEKIRIRAMFDEYGKNVEEAFPAKPVEVLGFSKVPPIGAYITPKPSVETQPTIIQKDFSALDEQKKLKIILKADTRGSLEAILDKLGPNIQIITGSIGEISESEILQAQASSAIVIGFNVKIAKAAQKIAKDEKILVKTYQIIYELLEEIDEVAKVLAEGEKEEILGQGKIIASFTTSDGKIAGIKVILGHLTKNDRVRLLRNDQEVGLGRIINLKKGKEDVVNVEQGIECGAKLSSDLDFQINDVLLSFKLKEIIL